MNFWSRISNVGVWGAVFLTISYKLLGKYSKPYFWPYFILVNLGAFLFLLAELMKFLTKYKERRDRMKS